MGGTDLPSMGAGRLPGYSGTLSVTARVKDVETVQTFRLGMDVLNLTLPVEHSARGVLDTYGDIVKHLRLNGDADAVLDAERCFYRLAREHRMFIHAIPFPQSGRPRPDYLPDFSRDAQGRLVADWSRFDMRYGD